FVRLALLHRFVRRVARAAHRGDPEGKERAPFRFTEVRLEVRVELDEARHHREVRRVDHLPLRVVNVRVRDDAGDPVAVDDDVDVRADLVAFHVDEPAGVYDRMPRGDGRRVLQIERDGVRLAGLDVDDAKLVERLIEDVARIALPARRVGAFR